MTIKEFEYLSFKDQADHLLRSAIFIGKDCSGEQVSTVYQLDNFYVKLTYEDYRKVVACVEFFASPDDVETFIEQVSIDEVLISL